MPEAGHHEANDPYVRQRTTTQDYRLRARSKLNRSLGLRARLVRDEQSSMKTAPVARLAQP